VCCNEACDGTCYSCNQAGSVGTCKAIDGAQDPTASVTCVGNDVCTTPAGGTPSCKIKDGEPCTNSTDCLHGSCLTIYRDADGDGYGGGAGSRVCVGSMPAGYVTTGGDCCDSDAGAHPGEATYLSEEDACGSFDWNCNGIIERAATTTTTCGCLNLGKLGSTCNFCR
jgi:hypothetical protein